MTKTERLYAEAVAAGRAKMAEVRAWYASPASHEFVYNASPEVVKGAARLRAWEVVWLVLQPLRMAKKARRELIDRACAEADRSDDVDVAFAELARAEQKYRDFRQLRADLGV